jgi:hypothetical protein
MLLEKSQKRLRAYPKTPERQGDEERAAEFALANEQRSDVGNAAYPGFSDRL